MRLSTGYLLTSLLLFLFFPYHLLAECTAPSSPGVRICSPSPNSTLVYIPALEFNSTPAFGASITQFIVYDNDNESVAGLPGQTGETIINAATYNGFHHIVINAWDTAGHLYQASVSFTVAGDGYSLFCPAPSSPGINFCEPPARGAVLSTYYGVSATATGYSSIAAMRLYVDGKAQITQPNSNQLSTAASVGTQGNHTVAFVAWDNSGHVFTSTRKIYSTYTYSLVNCPPKGNDPCSPGFNNPTPAPNDYVGTSFTIQVQVLNNPNPISALKAYIDNTLVATSDGPAMMSPVENAPTGTHIITLQAWDTTGVMYRYQYNVNINMAH